MRRYVIGVPEVVLRRVEVYADTAGDALWKVAAGEGLCLPCNPDLHYLGALASETWKVLEEGEEVEEIGDEI